MEKILYEFQTNAEMREAVKAFLFQSLESFAVTRVFSGGSVEGILEAKQAIDQAFKDLDTNYAKPI
jgi:hypothetical protein